MEPEEDDFLPDGDDFVLKSSDEAITVHCKLSEYFLCHKALLFWSYYPPNFHQTTQNVAQAKLTFPEEK